MSDVFISYTRANRDRVKCLVDLLRKNGVDVWWDGDISAGMDYHAELEKQISSAKCVVVVWSKESVKREWVLTEADFARSRGVLIPVLFDPVEPPLAFRLVQAADLISWVPNQPHPGIYDLLKAITTKTSSILTKTNLAGVQTKPPPRLAQSEMLSKAFISTNNAKATRKTPVISQNTVQQPRQALGALKLPDQIKIRWKLALPGEVHQPPIVGPEGEIYLITRNGAVVAANETGRMQWSAIVGGGGGIGGQGIVYSQVGDVLAVTDGYINCISSKGTNRWRWTEKGGVTSAPAVDLDGTVYAMTNKSTLWGISKSGKSLWNQELCKTFGGGSWPSPAYSGDGVVYAACKGRNVYGVSANNGDLIWEFAINDKVSSSPAVGSDRTGYFASDAGWVFAIDLSGQQQWVASVSGGSGKISKIDAPLTIAGDDTILVAPRHGKVFAIAPTGEILWSTAVGGQGTGDRPAAASPDGRVYAATTGRELIGLSANGQEFMRISSGDWVSAPSVGPDNTLYIGIGTTLFALDVHL